MRILSTTACTGRSFDAFLEIYKILKEPLDLQGLELAVGIPFTTDDILKIKQAGIDTVLWHDAFWFVGNRKQETYPSVAAEYFALHSLFSSMGVNVPLWSIHPYKSHKPQAAWTDDLLHDFCLSNWDKLEYQLPQDAQDDEWVYCNRQLSIVLENMLPNAPCYNNLQSILQSYSKFCIDYSHVNIWCKNNREQTMLQCLLATSKAAEIHLSSNKGYRDSHDYIPADEWFMGCIDHIEKMYSLYITYESLPVEYKQYGRLDKR
ncbi:MAG: hypothetical protein IM613_12440 [Cytophagales bacterium]|nr:hypothetical protein [Cytophagales bacterium]